MEHLVVTGFVDGKRARDRQRETFLTYLGKFTKIPLLRLANDRVVWSNCVQNDNQRLYEDLILIDDDDMEHVCFYVCCSDCVGVCGNVCCVAAVVKNSVF